MKLCKVLFEGEERYALKAVYGETPLARESWFKWERELRLWVAPNKRLASRFIAFTDDEEIKRELAADALELGKVWNRVRIEDDRLFIFEGDRRNGDVLIEAGFDINYTERRFETYLPSVALRLIDYAADADFAIRVAAIEKAKKAQVLASRAAAMEINLPAPPDLDYLPYQKAGIHFAMQRPGTLIADEPGLGKAQSLDSKLLTPKGWKAMGRIKVGDFVIGSEGKPVTVTGVYPQGLKDMFRVTFNDGSSTECCNDHLWEVTTSTRRWRGNKPFILTLEEIRERGLHDSTGVKNKWIIPVIKPVEFAAQEFYIAPYIFGLLLSGGGLCHRVMFSTVNPEIVSSIGAALPEGYQIKHSSRCDYRIIKSEGTRKFDTNLIDLEMGNPGVRIPSHKKFIPHKYLFASIEQRCALLQGLLDTDGYCAKDGTVQFSSSSKQLSDDLKTLVQSLGGVARQTVKKTTTHRDSYTLTLALPAEIKPFRLERKAERYSPGEKYQPQRAIKSIEYIGEKQAQCIKVDAPDSLYATDDFILTHNTIQALGVANALGPKAVKRILILVPASLKINWSREAIKWLIHGYSIGIAKGGKLPDTDVVIINFDIIARHVAELGQIAWDIYVIDEAHMIKNPKAKRTIAALSIQARIKLILTGTPILNRPIELLPILQTLDPDRWSNTFKFGRRYCAGKNERWGWDFSGSSNLDELQEMLRSTVMIRRLKRDVLTDLPPKRRSIIELDNKRITGLIKQEQEIQKDYAKRNREIAITTVLARTADSKNGVEGIAEYRSKLDALKAEQANSLREFSKARHDLALAKAQDAIDFIKIYVDEDSRYKMVVFAHHRDVLEILYKAFADRSVFLMGGMSNEEKQKSVDDFQQNPKVQIFFGSIRAAGVGWTLTSSAHVVCVELDPVPGIMTQAEDRTHRIGQKNAVLVQHLVYNNSLDVQIARMLVRKQEIADKALDDRVEKSLELSLAAKLKSDSEFTIEDSADTAGAILSQFGGDADDQADTEKLREEIRQSISWQTSPEELEKAEAEAEKSASLSNNIRAEDRAEASDVLENMKMLARVCDGADDHDAVGFNRFDAQVGHRLASLSQLNNKQFYLARKLSFKYRAQLAEIKVGNGREQPKKKSGGGASKSKTGKSTGKSTGSALGAIKPKEQQKQASQR